MPYLEKAENFAKLSKALESQRDVMKALSKAQKQLGRYQQALATYEAYDQLADSILYNRTTDEIAKLNVSFETERKTMGTKNLKNTG